jgi:hypothetical protein
MNFRVQFLDGSGSVVAKWSAYAHSARGAIELTEGLDWPAGAVHIRILDADGGVVHERHGRPDRTAGGLGSITICPNLWLAGLKAMHPFKAWLGILGRRPTVVFSAAILGAMGILQYGAGAGLEKFGLDHNDAVRIGAYVMMAVTTALRVIAFWRVLRRD